MTARHLAWRTQRHFRCDFEELAVLLKRAFSEAREADRRRFDRYVRRVVLR